MCGSASEAYYINNILCNLILRRFCWRGKVFWSGETDKILVFLISDLKREAEKEWQVCFTAYSSKDQLEQGECRKGRLTATRRNMGRQRTHVQQTLRPKPRPRPYARSGFVSFSGVGSVIPRVEQNANTSRVPYNYTNTQKWYTFLTNGRPKFHKNCLLFCDVIFESGSCSFWEESHSHLPGRHAEVKALKHISMKEQETDTNAR